MTTTEDLISFGDAEQNDTRLILIRDALDHLLMQLDEATEEELGSFISIPCTDEETREEYAQEIFTVKEQIDDLLEARGYSKEGFEKVQTQWPAKSGHGLTSRLGEMTIEEENEILACAKLINEVRNDA